MLHPVRAVSADGRSPPGRVCRRKAACFSGLLVASLGVSVVLVCYLARVDDPGGGLTGYDCSSDLSITGVQGMLKKGIAVDDVSFGCLDQMPRHWPHTQEPIKALRLFRSEQAGWDIRRILDFQKTLASYVRRNGARVLVGTQITCSEEEDDADWKITKTLLHSLGPEHVLGLAVGNELDLLFTKEGVTPECVNRIWGGYLLQKVQSRYAELKSVPGFDTVPVTSVFTASIIWNTAGKPFTDTKDASVNTFLTKVLSFLEDPARSWVFTLNFYPYFDPNLVLDPDGVHCKNAMARCRCFDNEECLTLLNVIRARQQIKALTGSSSSRFWVGEVGWSAPMATTLPPGMHMHYCKEFSGYRMLYDYYRNFLAWDFDLPPSAGELQGDLAPPEMAFYFTMRDSGNFGDQEYFGLIEKCGDKRCKLSRARVGGAFRAPKGNVSVQA